MFLEGMDLHAEAGRKVEDRPAGPWGEALVNPS